MRGKAPEPPAPEPLADPAAHHRGPGDLGVGGGPAGSPVNLADYELLALARLAPGPAAYYAGAAADEVTLRENSAAFRRLRFIPRIGVEIRDRDPSVEIFGRRWPAPVMIAPMAIMRMADPDGEVAVARACAARGLTMSLSTVASSTIEEVGAAGAPSWFQLYLLDDPARNAGLLARAADAGYEAIILTMDAPILGRRERDLRAGFTLPDDVHYANIRRGGNRRGSAYGDDEIKQSNTWDDLSWTVRNTRLPVVVKGVLHPDDARKAIDLGAAGIAVSNHGGRQLDGSIAAIDALPAVADAIAGRVPVLLDGGIRRGSDVLASLARGARAVMVGRPILWALTVAGEAGVGRALDLLLAEFELALGLAGVARADSVPGDLLAR